MTLQRQDNINNLALNLLDYNLDFDVTHEFQEKYYIRTMYIKADTIIVGFKHAKPHLNVLKKGKCTLYSNFRTLHLKAYSVFASPKLEQKSFYFVEDSIFSTIHNTYQTDIKTIEKEFVLSSTPAYNSKKVYIL